MSIAIETEATDHYRSRFDEIGMLIRLAGECNSRGHDAWAESIDERIQEMPLSVELVEIRPHREECDWSILLGTGGPADRVLVSTDMTGRVERATYQFQDWFTPWTEAREQNDELVLAFAERFYFGEVAVAIDGRES